jgi:hypothetical protein
MLLQDETSSCHGIPCCSGYRCVGEQRVGGCQAYHHCTEDHTVWHVIVSCDIWGRGITTGNDSCCTTHCGWAHDSRNFPLVEGLARCDGLPTARMEQTVATVSHWGLVSSWNGTTDAEQ